MIPLSFIYALYYEITNVKKSFLDIPLVNDVPDIIKHKIIKGHIYTTDYHPECSLPSQLHPWSRYSIELYISNKISYTNINSCTLTYVYNNSTKKVSIHSIILPKNLELLAIYYIKLGYWAYEIPGIGIYVTPPIGKETFFDYNTKCKCRDYKINKVCAHTIVKQYYLKNRKSMYYYTKTL